MKLVTFTCKLCGKGHPATELLDVGIAKIPDSITTEKNNMGEWYFKCVQCNKLSCP